MLVVGITGKARSGKDTLADCFVQEDWIKRAFADPIRTMLQAGFYLDYPELFGDEKEILQAGYQVSPRYMMQTLGTEWGRNLIHPDVWVIHMSKRIQGLEKAGIETKGVVIPDVRFDNEANWIRSRGGWIIHINREETQEVNKHSSELGVRHDAQDIIIENNGTLEELQKVGKDLEDSILRFHYSRGDY